MRKPPISNLNVRKLVNCIKQGKNYSHLLIPVEEKEIEQKKINYAKKHFEALGHTDIKYDVIDSYQALRDKIMR